MSAPAEILYPVILSGGSGTRLWPMSRSLYPEAALGAARRRTACCSRRCAASPAATGFAPPLIVANDEHRFIIAEQLREIGIAPPALLLEPVGRNTAPAAAVAALWLAAKRPDALMLVMPSDHVIADLDAFHAAIGTRASAARGRASGHLRHHPGARRDRLRLHRRGRARSPAVDGVFAVARFIEKPDAADAERYRRRRRLFLEQRHLPVPGGDSISAN